MPDFLPARIPTLDAPSRSLRRNLASLNATTTIDLARVCVRAEVEAAKIDAITSLAATAMTNVGYLSVMEANISQAVPSAAGRVQLIANTATVAIAGVLMNAERKL